MKILVVTNLFPPHQADTDDFRCQNVTDALRKRGHTMRVLTSTFGLASDSGHSARNVGSDQHDAVIQRLLRLNGAFGLESVSGLGELRELETRNNSVLREAIAEFTPDLIHVWSLHGISKSLLLTLRRANLPVAFHVSDTWLADELRADPWLSWWHREKVPALHKVQRAGLELSGQRAKWDTETPTFIEPNTNRLPAIFDPGTDAGFNPNPSAAFQFRRIHFSSSALQTAAAQAGFCVDHGEVIHPGVDTQLFYGEVKPSTTPVKKFLIVTHLTRHCGVDTAIEAIRLARAQGAKATLTIHGRGDSEVQARLRTQAAQAEVPVEFRTSGAQRDLPGIYRAHDAFIHPMEREESFVGAPLEAMACGLPVIVNQDCGAEDLFRSRESCLSFPSGDSGLLANRILELIQTPGRAGQLAQAGQSEVLTRYQFTTSVESVERYLEDSVAQWQSV